MHKETCIDCGKEHKYFQKYFCGRPLCPSCLAKEPNTLALHITYLFNKDNLTKRQQQKMISSDIGLIKFINAIGDAIIILIILAGISFNNM